MRILFSTALASIVVCTIASTHLANAGEAWPLRPVRVIVPFPAGGVIDATARLVGDGLSRQWGKPVVIENRPGADASLGTAAFANARDDHTLLYGVAAAFTVNPLVQERLPYDPVRDCVPISAVANTVIAVAVNDRVPAQSLAGLARLAKAQPGKLLWGSGPSLPRYVFTAFLKRRDLDMPYVGYRDAATPPLDLGEGRIQVLITSLQGTNAPVQSGKARIVAVANTRRAPTLPDVPTVTEAGYPEMGIDGLSGFFGWRDMSATLRDKIAADIQIVMRDADLRSRIEASGQHLLGGTPAEFAAAIDMQRARVDEIARLVDLKAAK